MFISGFPTNIKEVGGSASLGLDQIHSSHGKSSTVNHAANVTIEGNVIEVMSLSLNLLPVFLGEVLAHEDLFLSVSSIVIDVDFAVADFDSSGNVDS